MDQPSLYQRTNGVQRRDAKEILDEYGHLLRWRADGRDSLLDVGSGTGDVLKDFVLPLLPRGATIVGTDVSERMVRFAREAHCANDNRGLLFDTLDIGANDVKHFVGKWGKFDHITSFYCLHWVRYQRTAFSNIYSLLKMGGDCLLVFLAKNPIFDIYNQLSRSAKWKKYMTDVEKFISPYQYCEDPTSAIEELLSSVGFTEYKIKITDKIYIYEGIESLKSDAGAVHAVNPFCDRIPTNLHEDFLNDYITIVSRMSLNKSYCENSSECKFISPYKLVIAYATKDVI